ncbi:hypothetical protein [Simiduia agarivorans]|uniref:Uncharacterized protein n=1 Tax=Simiduia agarivorans (strain DSM 21679 / JCM 13881 / BCRC 17597 / SA1) TaxID=1117647 RepID=K4KHT1_SIMAS|nr:hypothetical protein [Simiduia agarivorans]AFU97533.1 hypothetical protein M5M_01530 [Simiduia agarivorans SA1 = DSM 21679]
MDALRTLLALCLFLLGCACLFYFFRGDAGWSAVALALAFFVVAHWVIPKDRRRREEGWDWLEVACEISDLPFRVLWWFFRSLGRLLSNKVDLDIDV